MVNIRVEINGWRKRCANQEDIASVSDYRIIPYIDKKDEKLWCLDIEYIKSEYIKNQAVKNPYTGRMLDPKFVTMIVETFGNLDWEDEDEEEPPSPPEPPPPQPVLSTPPEEMLAPGLINLVLENIHECQRELDEDELNDDGRCPAMENTDDTEEDGDTADETDSDEDVPPPQSTPPGDRLSPTAATNCDQCGKAVGTNPINTIEEGQNSYKRISFCDTSCAEKREFPKSRRSRNGTKKRKKKQTS